MQKNFIWTNHAKARLKERKISSDLIIQTILNPEITESNIQGGVEFRRKFNNQTIAAVVKENEKGERIIVSCWVNPPNPGTKDARKKARYYEMQKASLIKKLWLTFLDQVGL